MIGKRRSIVTKKKLHPQKFRRIFQSRFFRVFYLLGEKGTQLGEDRAIGGVIFECCFVAVKDLNVFPLCLKIRADEIENSDLNLMMRIKNSLPISFKHK